MTEDQRAGVFYGMLRAFTKNFKAEIDQWIEKQVASRPQDEVQTIPDEEKKALQERRSELSKQVNAIIDMAYTFGDAQGDRENNPDPRMADS